MIVRAKDGRAFLWCPGCDALHCVSFGSGDGVRWQFDGNADRPTISPSILIRGTQWPPEHPKFVKHRHPNVAPGGDTICHSFVTDGRWQFLGDCTHELAGQTVPCVPIPDGWFGEGQP